MYKKISIVMSYYNRRKLLFNTLQSISQSEVVDKLEIVIVDDGSNSEHDLSDIKEYFDLDIKVIKIENHNKWWLNPCIPYNIALANSTGDAIIIQNPECFHTSDICSYVDKNLVENEYISTAVYALNKETTDKLGNGELDDISLNPWSCDNNPNPDNGNELAFYNHSVYRPKAFHWCTAITRKDFVDIGGFDERFAFGCSYDDDDLVFRIRAKNMKIKIIDDLVVFHQWHGDVHYASWDDKVEDVTRNRLLLEKIWNNGSGKAFNTMPYKSEKLNREVIWEKIVGN
tara:strand:- start:42074 stop:42931 length:858 start_codon:yes stop_codon:yes gene_type:complete